jgi:probable HAF family extracellular repeat protein
MSRNHYGGLMATVVAGSLAAVVGTWPVASSAAMATFRSLGAAGVCAVSADGTTVVGSSGRWTAETGWRGLGSLPGFTGGGSSGARAVSADGSVIVGRSGNRDGRPEPFRWTAATGKVGLGFPGRTTSGGATAVSADGTVVAGSADLIGFRWTTQSGMTSLGYLSVPGYHRVFGVSADGSTIVGDDLDGDHVPVRWRPDGQPSVLWPSAGTALAASADGSVIVGTSSWAGEPSMPLLSRSGTLLQLSDIETLAGQLHIQRGQAQAVSADGKIVVGFYMTSQTPESFIWDSANGMRDLGGVLRDAGADLTGWKLASPGLSEPFGNWGAVGISADGTTIVGNGLHFGQVAGWIATIPEPGSTTCVGGALLLSLVRRRKRLT